MNRKLDLELSPELEIYRDKIEATIKPYIEIKLTNNDKPTWWQSKFGGLPYLPKGFEYPKSFDGEYLYLLAQINFAEVPHLEGFPKKGILQFYIAADGEFYGADFDNDPTQQNKFRVLYFSNIDLNKDNLITDFSFLPQLKDKFLLPFQGCCRVTYSLKYAPISPSDYKFNFFPLYEESYEEIGEEYYDKFSLGHKIGGYPDFTQSDPRPESPQDEEYILLFQIDSEQNNAIDLCWGDVGIANFFIKKSNLEKLNFSDVWYNWDCG